MPPAAIASSVRSAMARSSAPPLASSSSRAEAGGNLGAPPKPPRRRSAAARSFAIASSSPAAAGGSGPGSIAPIAPSRSRVPAARSRISSRWRSKASTTASITIRKLGMPRLSSGGK